MRYCLLFLFLAMPSLALTPEKTVEKVYQTHKTSHSSSETIEMCQSCFTPGFLAVMERALVKKRGGTGAYVDFDFFVNSQSGFPHFEVGRAIISGKKAQVPIRIWNDSRAYKFEEDPVKRDQQATPALIHLIDVGNGLQITNIEFLPRVLRVPDGDIVYLQGSWIRAILDRIAED